MINKSNLNASMCNSLNNNNNSECTPQLSKCYVSSSASPSSQSTLLKTNLNINIKK